MIIQPTITSTFTQPENSYSVQFVGYDGSILKSTYIQSGGTVIAPTMGDLPIGIAGVTLQFQNWNNPLNNIVQDMVIGACRKTSDDCTYFKITTNANIPASPSMYFVKADTSLMTIFWGDGTSSTSSASGAVTFTAHTYSTTGSYVIKVQCTGNYQLGQGASGTRIISGSQIVGLTEAYLSKYVTGISDNGFINAKNLVKINIPNEMTYIGVNAFQQCTNLYALVFPQSVTVVKNNCFGTDKRITVISLPNTLTAIEDSAFNSTPNLMTINLPNSITSIGISSLNNCRIFSYTKTITLPTSLTSLGASAFISNYAQELVIPSGITVLNTSVFATCSYLTKVTFQGNITSVGDSAFSSCYNVTSFSFPASLNSSSTGIAASAFLNCYNVLDYYFYSTTVPPLANINAFSLINPFCKIHVPVASATAYKTATNWSTYANYIVGDL